MEIKITKSNIISSLLWKLMERAGTQGIQLITQILLARLLAPNDYGVISLITIFITIANVFVQNSFGIALIQKKKADDGDFSSVFFISLVIAGVMYVILFLVAPLIADFYQKMELMPVLRVLSLTLFFGAVNSVQNAVIAKGMQFRKLFFASLGAVVVSGVVGIVSAYKGLGVWALVTQQLTSQVMVTLILWFSVKWRPITIFSFERVKGLFSFGWKILISSLIDTLYTNLRGLIIGKVYSTDLLGFYNRGEQFPQIIVAGINGSIQSVILPALVSEQENRQRIKDMIRRCIVTSSYIIFPVMVMLAVVAEPLVKLLLTDKWLPCVPYLQIFCATYALWPIHTANLQAITALGRSDIFLKLEIIKEINGLLVLGVSLFYGPYMVALGTLYTGVIDAFINAYPNIRLINYSYKEQLKDICSPLTLSLVMGIILYCFRWLPMTSWAILILQVLAGGAIYLGASKAFKLESYSYFLSIFTIIFESRKKVSK